MDQVTCHHCAARITLAVRVETLTPHGLAFFDCPSCEGRLHDAIMGKGHYIINGFEPSVCEKCGSSVKVTKVVDEFVSVACRTCEWTGSLSRFELSDDPDALLVSPSAGGR